MFILFQKPLTFLDLSFSSCCSKSVLIYLIALLFFLSGFSFTDTDNSWDHFLFHSTIFTHSRTFRQLFATLHVRWLSNIFNRTACIYQTAARWDLPPYRITIWLIDDVKLVFFACLLNDLILGFCYNSLDTVNRWTRTRIDYYPCITSEPTNQVC